MPRQRQPQGCRFRCHTQHGRRSGRRARTAVVLALRLLRIGRHVRRNNRDTHAGPAATVRLRTRVLAGADVFGRPGRLRQRNCRVHGRWRRCCLCRLGDLVRLLIGTGRSGQLQAAVRRHLQCRVGQALHPARDAHSGRELWRARAHGEGQAAAPGAAGRGGAGWRRALAALPDRHQRLLRRVSGHVPPVRGRRAGLCAVERRREAGQRDACDQRAGHSHCTELLPAQQRRQPGLLGAHLALRRIAPARERTALSCAAAGVPLAAARLRCSATARPTCGL